MDRTPKRRTGSSGFTLIETIAIDRLKAPSTAEEKAINPMQWW